MARKRTREKADAEIDVGAFADIAFLLIIFFILTTSISRPSGQEVSLPQAQTPQNKKVDERTPTINVLENKILFGESEDKMQEIQPEALRMELVKRDLHNAEESKRMIVLEVGEEVDYDRFFKIVTMIADSGGIVALVEDVK
jgi:biopolymer transport protein ExbD